MTIKFTPKLLIFTSFSTLAIIAVFFIYKYIEVSFQLESLKTDSIKLTALLNTENTKIIEKIGNLIQLPEEKPQQIVTISDTTTLAKEPLLSKAEVGDVFVLYTNAKKLILYRPSQNKIIDVIPISSNTTTTSPTPTQKP